MTHGDTELIAAPAPKQAQRLATMWSAIKSWTCRAAGALTSGRRAERLVSQVRQDCLLICSFRTVCRLVPASMLCVAGICVYAMVCCHDKVLKASFSQ